MRLKNHANHRHAEDQAADAGRLSPTTESTDGGLLTSIAGKDQAAFAELYDRFADRMFGLILKLFPQRTEAEDVLQEVFLHIWNRADAYNPSLGSPLVWMMLVTRARAIDHLRRRGAHSAALAKLQSRNSANGHAHAANGNGSVASVGLDLSRLPAEQFEAIHLTYHGGLTCSQIAELRQLPLGTVKTRIRLGMMKLRELAERTREAARP